VGSSQADRIALTALEPGFVGEVRDVDLRRVNPEGFERLRVALDEHPVLVVRDQELTPAELVEAGRGFGELERYERPSPGYEEHLEIVSISNDERRGLVTRPFWHPDGLGRASPTEVTIFYAVEAPSRGGGTDFVDTRALYESLEPADREALEALVAEVHGGARHSLVKEHPRTGRKALYVNLGATTELVGVDREQAEGVFAELWHLYDEGPIYRHAYRRGDFLVWDNYAVAHSAGEMSPPPGETRLLLRLDVLAPGVGPRRRRVEGRSDAPAPAPASAAAARRRG
jgi:alpha-ketoglutarate-dependent taurine dioxygenase